jgi:hypothetical protein
MTKALVAMLILASEERSAQMGDVATNTDLLLISLYKFAKARKYRDVMRDIEATGIDLHA